MDGQMDGWGEECKNRGMGKQMDEQMNSQTITKKRPPASPPNPKSWLDTVSKGTRPGGEALSVGVMEFHGA